MGREQIRQREHFLFHFACIVILMVVFIVAGCFSQTMFSKRQQGQDQVKKLLLEARNLAVKGDYKASLEKNHEISKRYPQVRDHALFQIGLIYADSRYPNRDYGSSSKYFKRVIDEFPASELKDQALLWSLLLGEVMEKEGLIATQEKDMRVLQERIESLTQENATKTRELKQLKEKLDLLKEIDLTIEDKKRKTAQ